MGTLSVDKILKTSTGAATFTLPATDGTAGQVWQTDGAGQLSVAALAADTVTATQIAATSITNTEISASAAIAVDKLETGNHGDTLFWASDTQGSRLAAGTSGQFLKTQGAGANPVWDDVPVVNSPYFSACMSADQTVTDNTWTKVNIDTASLQSGSTYDTTNKRWTPGVTGKYLITVQGILRADSSNKLSNTKAAIYKNGAVNVFYEGGSQPENTWTNGGISASWIMSLTSSDYVEFWANVNVYSGTASIARTGGIALATWFTGFLLSV